MTKVPSSLPPPVQNPSRSSPCWEGGGWGALKNNNLFYLNYFFFSFIRVCVNDTLRNLCVNLYVLNGYVFSAFPLGSFGPTWHFPTSCPSNRKFEKRPVPLVPVSSCLRVKVWLQTFPMMPNPTQPAYVSRHYYFFITQLFSVLCEHSLTWVGLSELRVLQLLWHERIKVIDLAGTCVDFEAFRTAALWDLRAKIRIYECLWFPFLHNVIFKHFMLKHGALCYQLTACLLCMCEELWQCVVIWLFCASAVFTALFLCLCEFQWALKGCTGYKLQRNNITSSFKLNFSEIERLDWDRGCFKADSVPPRWCCNRPVCPLSHVRRK